MKKKNENYEKFYVKKIEAKSMRKEMPGIFRKVKLQFKEKTEISFQERIVGSAKRNLIIRFGDSIYDTDYQIELKGKKAKNALANIKKTLYEILKNTLNTFQKDWRIEISTSVITIKKIENDVLVHSFDLAIIKEPEVTKSLKASGKEDKKYVWNEIRDLSKAYEVWRKNFKLLNKKVREIYFLKRQERHNSPINDNKDYETYKSSSSLFAESVYEAAIKKGVWDK